MIVSSSVLGHERELQREVSLAQLIDAERGNQLEMRQTTAEDSASVFRRGQTIGAEVYCFGDVDSTYNLAREIIAIEESEGRDISSGTVVLARSLQDAHGRFGRKWDAPAGGVWMTLVIHPEIGEPLNGLYTIASGVAVCETIQGYGVEARTKWPNDVIVDGKKISGALLEIRGNSQPERAYYLLGIGVNVNNADFPSRQLGIATSLKDHTKTDVSLDEFVARLLGNLSWNLGLAEQYQADSDEATHDRTPENPLTVRFAQLIYKPFGTPVRYANDLQKQDSRWVTPVGIDFDGALLIAEEPGRLTFGELSFN